MLVAEQFCSSSKGNFMYRKVITAVALTLGASIVHAQETGWYGGLDLGRSHLSGIDVDSIKKDDTALGFDLGYRVNRNFALEGAYADLGKFPFSSAAGDGDYRARALSLSAVALMPVWEKFSVYGKAGIAHTQAKLEGPSSASDSGNGLLAGVGVMYDINRNVYAKAGWDHYANVGSDETGKGSVNLYSVGLGYRF
jgi:OOP family OmpA-OmpF porin